MPYRIDVQLKSETFEQFYMSGHVIFHDGSKQLVKSVVDRNRSLVEVDAETLHSAQESIYDHSVLEDAWCELCSEQELEHLQCKQECKSENVQEEHKYS